MVENSKRHGPTFTWSQTDPKKDAPINETGLRLKKLRDEHGLSRRKIAQLLNCSEMTIVRLERFGGRNPSAATEMAVKRLLDVLESKPRSKGQGIINP
jgi:transcriptional regulator with XRE-family HTH domain